MSRASAETVTVAILAKAPIAGFAKTRLIPVLGAEGAAALQARLIMRAVEITAAVGPVMLWATPDASHALFKTLSVSIARQPDGDLGARMLAAIEAAAGPVLVIGTDCPSLTTTDLLTAANHLRDGVDVVAIPAADGGYGLIGMRRPHPEVFSTMEWSTPSVMAETRRRLMRLGLAWREPSRTWDVDRPEDLERLRRSELAGLLTA
jgi:uncharacterized protein